MLDRFLLLWLCLSSLLAYLWPQFGIHQIGDPFVLGKQSLPQVIFVTMFCVGWLLPRKEVKQLFVRWPTVLFGTFVQYTSMPMLAYAISEILPLSDDAQLGIIMVGCVPGAMASNVLTILARGNISYSVSLTTSATICSPFFVPLILQYMLKAKGLDAEVQVDPAKTFWFLCWTVVIPIVVGHLVGTSIQKGRRLTSRIAKALASLSILWIIAVVVGINRDVLSEGSQTTIIAVLALNILGYVVGVVAGKAFGIEVGMRRALAIEIGMQNAGLGTAMASTIFADRPQVLIPTALFTFGCMFTGTILASWWNRYPPNDEFEDEHPHLSGKSSDLN